MIRSTLCAAAVCTDAVKRACRPAVCTTAICRAAICRLALGTLAAATLMTTAAGQNVREKTIMRVFWQDAASQKLSYANLTASTRWNLRRGWVGGFPQLDTSTQSLGEMVAVDGQVFVSVTAATDAAAGGWLCLDSGAFEEPHGNHTHWKYTRTPRVRQSKLAAGHGQTSGLMLHNGTVVHADSTGACTLLSAGQMKFGGERGIRQLTLPKPARFCLVAGQQLFTAAESGEGIVTASYDISAATRHLSGSEFPGAQLLGIVHNSGRTFLASDQGIQWEPSPASEGETVSLDLQEMVHGITSEQNWVLFTCGDGEDTRLCLTKAADPGRGFVTLPLPGPDGTKPRSLSTRLSLGKRYAFVIQETSTAGTPAAEQLVIIRLDPNKDGDFSDATIRQRIDLGTRPPAANGNSDICFDAYGRYAVVSSPAAGILTVISLSKMSVVARFQVGGAPGRMVGVGAAEHFH